MIILLFFLKIERKWLSRVGGTDVAWQMPSINYWRLCACVCIFMSFIYGTRGLPEYVLPSSEAGLVGLRMSKAYPHYTFILLTVWAFKGSLSSSVKSYRMFFFFSLRDAGQYQFSNHYVNHSSLQKVDTGKE